MVEMYGLPAALPEKLWPDAARLRAVELWMGEFPARPEFVIGSYHKLIEEISLNGWGNARKRRPRVGTPIGNPTHVPSLISYREWDFNWIGWVRNEYVRTILRDQPVFSDWDAVAAHRRVNQWMIDQYQQAGFDLPAEEETVRLHRS